MSNPEAVSRERSTPGKSGQCGEAIIVRKLPNGHTSLVWVALRLEEGRRARYVKLDRPGIFELSDELRHAYGWHRFFLTRRKWTHDYFFGYGMEGVRVARMYLDFATGQRLGDAGITFTRFVGLQLGREWGGAVQWATALACIHALGDPPLARQIEPGEWNEI